MGIHNQKIKQQAEEFAELYTMECFNISLRLTEEYSLPYKEACSLVFKCMKSMGIEITWSKVEAEYLKEKGIKDEK